MKPLNRKLRQRYSQATVLETSHSPALPVLIHLFPSERTYRNGAKSITRKQATPRPRAAIASHNTGLSELVVFPISRFRNLLERNVRTAKIPIETTTNSRLPLLAASDTRCNRRISTDGFTNEAHTATSATQPAPRQIPSVTTEMRRMSRARRPASARTLTTMQLSCRGGTGLSIEECRGSMSTGQDLVPSSPEVRLQISMLPTPSFTCVRLVSRSQPRPSFRLGSSGRLWWWLGGWSLRFRLIGRWVLIRSWRLRRI
jgi:hypothetical protein